VWLARSATSAMRALKIVWRHTIEDERLSREHPSQLALFHVGRGGCAGRLPPQQKSVKIS